MSALPNVWYLSFAADEGFRGAVILRGGDHVDDARAEASRLGLDPGGQIAGWMLTESAWDATPSGFRNKLLSKSEIADLDALMGGPGEAMTLAEAEIDDDIPPPAVRDDHRA